jgi:hypothetical protein
MSWYEGKTHYETQWLSRAELLHKVFELKEEIATSLIN